jgi:hypothetical protein
MGGGHGHVSLRANVCVEPTVADDITAKNASAVKPARAPVALIMNETSSLEPEDHRLMQTWRGCLPIIGYFAELQERHAMTQTSEPGIKSEHSEGERTRGNGAQTTNTERHAIIDNSKHGKGEI